MQGAVLCLAQAAQYLFSGGQDSTIKVWQFDAASQAFQPWVSLLLLQYTLHIVTNVSLHLHGTPMILSPALEAATAPGFSQYTPYTE